MKINFKKAGKEKITEILVQILILIISSFAFCYILHSITQSVFAQSTDVIQTCQETNDGHYCQEFLKEEIQENCNSTIFPGSMEEFSECQLGCCYDDYEGICTTKSPKAECEGGGGEWSDNEDCNLNECEMACCILGTEAKFTTEQRCAKLSADRGIPADFKSDVKTEIACLLLVERDNEGACVFDVNIDFKTEIRCEFTTRQDCYTKTGQEDNFYKDFLCSNPQLNTTCTKQNSTACVENKEAVYWFDSCGNRENIYDTNKDRSWNNGMVLSPEKSCGADSLNGNVNSATCGNCNYLRGSICGAGEAEIGDYVCKDLSCEIHGEKITNGESWCVYEGIIGDGKDVVGSRHIKKACHDGEIITELCADFRNEICVQSDVERVDGEIFSEAACRVNRWRECVEINLEENADEKKEKCEKISDCKFHNVDVDKNFKFSVCTPQYPPGFDVKNDYNAAELVCAQATQKCTAIKIKEIDGWEWVANEDCTKMEFTEKMNDYCYQLGDCGGYINIEGDFDKGFSVSGEAPNSLTQSKINEYKRFAQDNLNQKPAEPGKYEGILAKIRGDDGKVSSLAAGGAIAGGIIGGLSAYSPFAIGLAEFAAGLGQGTVSVVRGGTWSSSSTSATGSPQNFQPSDFGAKPTANYNAIGAGLGAAAGAYVAIALFGKGLPPKAQLVASLIGGIGGAALATTSSAFGGGAVAGTGISGFISTFIAAFIWAIIIVIIVILIMKAFGVGKKKEYVNTFKCLPWEAPTGGNNCDVCNQGDVLCSEYRCNSLGQTCELINQGSENVKCINNPPDDVSSPKISPLYGFITPGHGYNNINNNGFEIKKENGNCINEFTNIEFGIKTDKSAQCKYGTEITQDYEDMVYFGNNAYLINHTFAIMMIGPNVFKHQYNLTDEEIQDLGKLKYYVKCKSVNGMKNSVPYVIESCVNLGPDLTPPMITNTDPWNKAFIKYGATEVNLSVWVSEPANCSWSKQDVDYEEMQNKMVCLNGLENYGLYGWRCYTTLTNITDQPKFYIKCKDQPWLPDDNDSRNAMEESYVYELISSESELVIKETIPKDSEAITSSTVVTSVDVKIKTSGGAENGEATCYFKFAEDDSYIRFLHTFTNIHEQTFSNLVQGQYDLYLKCEDAAGNIAENITSFELDVDSSGPRITRYYYDGVLKIKTNEKAECRYDFNRMFVFENASSMGGPGFEHSAPWKLDTYYVQCMDKYENKGNKATIRAYDLV